MITTWKSLVPWERWFLLLLLLLTLGLRFGYVAEMNQTLFLTQLRLDELYHNNWAKSIAAGNIIGDQIYFRAPLYAYLLGLCFALFGHSYIIPRIFQHFLGTLSVLLVYFLARKLFGKKVAVLSSILMATYAAIIYNENKFLLESILLPQAVLFFLLLYSVKEKPTFWKWFWLGILFGLICITRPIFLPFLLILALIILIWYRTIFPAKNYLNWLCGIFLGSMIIIAPVTLRNYIVGGNFVLIASQGGINFYIGNNPSADGFSSTMPGSIGNRWNNRDIAYPVQQSTGRYPKISEIDSYWQKQAFNFIIKHPYEFILLTIKKLYLFWNNIEIPNNGSFYLYSQFSKILTWLPTGFWIVGPLGLLGMWIGWNEKRYRAITIFIIYYTAIAILFFVCDRFRLPIVPFLCIFAGLSISKLWDHLKKQANKTIGKYIAVLFLFGLIVNSNLYNLQKGNRASDLFHLGNMDLSAGNYTRAILYYEQIPKTKHLIQDVCLNWGVAELRLGRIENAVKQFQHELEIFPESYDALANLTRIYSMTGAPEKTIQYARQAIQMKPYVSTAYIDLVFALMELRRYEEAESTLTTFISSYGRDALYEESVLAGIHLMRGKIDLAEREYRSILNRIKPQIQPGYEPEFQYSKEYSIGGNWEEFKAKVYYSLGHIFIKRNQYDSTLVYLSKATIAFPKFADAWISMGNVFQEINRAQEADSAFVTGLRINPTNFQAWYEYGLLLEAMNRIEDARRAFETALKYKPDFTEAKTELEAIQQKK